MCFVAGVERRGPPLRILTAAGEKVHVMVSSSQRGAAGRYRLRDGSFSHVSVRPHRSAKRALMKILNRFVQHDTHNNIT